jgi:hypothetical protein
MDTWAVDGDGADVAVGAEPGVPVRLTLAGEVGDITDGQVSVTAALSIEKAEQLRRFLGVAIGVARGEP